MFIQAITDFDHRLFDFLNSFAGRSETADTLFVGFAEITIFLLVPGLALFVWLKRKDASRAFAALQAMTAVVLGRVVFMTLIRFYIFRERPFVGGIVEQLVPHNPLENSFPSGHATAMFALAFSLLFFHRGFGVAYLILATMSSLARVVVGVHFPLDVLGGALVGALSAFVAKWIFDFLVRQKRADSSRR